MNKKKLKKLNNTILHIQTENAILKAENYSYRQALFNKKKKRRRGKQLFEELRANDGGGAQFFSPTKIQEARDLQTRREEAKVNEKSAKAAKAAAKKLQSQQRKVAGELRKLQRQEDQEAKKEAAKQKAREKEEVNDSRNATKQL